MEKDNKQKRKGVEVVIDCDCSKLYSDLPEAIKYLKKIYADHPDAQLEEHWTGYEDMEMRFVYHRLENDLEYATRIKEERYWAEFEANREADRRSKEKAAIKAKMAALEKELKNI